MKLFDPSFTIPLVVEKDADEAVLLAAQDLQRDLRALSGQENGFEFSSAADCACRIRPAMYSSSSFSSMRR